MAKEKEECRAARENSIAKENREAIQFEFNDGGLGKAKNRNEVGFTGNGSVNSKRRSPGFLLFLIVFVTNTLSFREVCFCFLIFQGLQTSKDFKGFTAVKVQLLRGKSQC